MMFFPPGVTTRKVACPSQVILIPFRFMDASFDMSWNFKIAVRKEPLTADFWLLADRGLRHGFRQLNIWKRFRIYGECCPLRRLTERRGCVLPNTEADSRDKAKGQRLRAN